MVDATISPKEISSYLKIMFSAQANILTHLMYYTKTRHWCLWIYAQLKVYCGAIQPIAPLLEVTSVVDRKSKQIWFQINQIAKSWPILTGQGKDEFLCPRWLALAGICLYTLFSNDSTDSIPLMQPSPLFVRCLYKLYFYLGVWV